jgi:cell division protein FtsI (penicillin-binding protein 3)
MAKPAVRLQVVQAGAFLVLLLLVARAGQVQLLQGRRWAAEAQAHRTEHIVLDARRGTMYTRDGTPIAVTQETYHVGIAPNELRHPSRDAAHIARVLKLPERDLTRRLGKRYVYFRGPYSAVTVEPLREVRGVHLEPVPQRFYPSPAFARAVVGRVDLDGDGASGLEKVLHSLLSGRPGSAVVLKDRAGREYTSPARVIAQPVKGHDVTLSLDAELQEIAQRTLDDAIRRLDAAGGDVVMLDPRTGEVLALASRQGQSDARPGALTDVFEPGSTAKIFAAAALLAHGRAATGDRVSGSGGRYAVPGREPIEDEHPQPSFTLADAIRLSSNIAMVKFGSRLEPAEHYAMLRDFGFGTPTSIEFPTESPGTLHPPREWSGVSAASLAMGYEIAVTPLQLAAAYAALANDGILLRPTLIKEIRNPGGRVVYRHRPEPVRRVVPARVAARLREMLEGVVESGTGTGAALATFRLAAKTGTARRIVNGRYAPGSYTASFAALFPAEDPQLVLVVKLDNPRRGSYFAAQTAAPVTRAMLEQALAAREVALDRARLSTASTPAEEHVAEIPPGVVPYVVGWPYRPDTVQPGPRRPVPNVSGKPLRDAVLALHRRGFRVNLKGWGVADFTWPAAGDSAAAGSVVTLFGKLPAPPRP